MRKSNRYVIDTNLLISAVLLEKSPPDIAVYVFGSRVDDSARGGDIDLLVQLEKPEYTACCMSKWITKVW